MSMQDSITIHKRGPVTEELILRFTASETEFFARIQIVLTEPDLEWSGEWWVVEWFTRQTPNGEAIAFEMDQPMLSWLIDHINDMLRQRSRI